MTFEELMGVAHAAVRKAGRSTEFSDRVMVRAVVTALRDELSKCDWDEGENMIDALNEILTSDGVEAAGGDNSGEIVTSPAAAPITAEDWLSLAKGTAFEAHASVGETKGFVFTETTPAAAPDVCVWTDLGPEWSSSCKVRFGAFASTKGRFFCPSCGRPISFKSEAAR